MLKPYLGFKAGLWSNAGDRSCRHVTHTRARRELFNQQKRGGDPWLKLLSSRVTEKSSTDAEETPATFKKKKEKKNTEKNGNNV